MPGAARDGRSRDTTGPEGWNMTVRRGTLYMGVFLIGTGAVTLGVAVGVLDTTAVAHAVDALWPLAVLALGLGLVLRTTSAALGAGIVAALVPGLALGASIVAVPDLPARWMDDAWTTRHAEILDGPFGRAAAADLWLCTVGSATINPEGVCK
jgi:hypothetical protein